MIDLSSSLAEKMRGFVIYPRSFMPKGNRLLLYGAPKVGKTSLALELARSAKKPIFIDCADTRFNAPYITSTLLKLFLERKFDLLIVDNFNPTFSLPNSPNIILTTHSLSHIPESILTSFEIKKILPLKFEEYVSFTKGALSLESIFSNFLKEGNLPEISFLPEFKRITRNQEIIRLFFLNDFGLFLSLLTYQAKPFSTYNLYTHLKQKTKISKDKIYNFIQSLLDSGIIILLPHIISNQPKKLFFYNFALPYAFANQPNFQAIFENLILCELLHYQAPIFYGSDCDFIMNDCAYFVAPFPTPQLIESKLANLSNTYKNIIFLTIDTNATHKNYHLLNFIDFTLQ